MGCSDSKDIKRHYYNSNFNTTSKASNNNSRTYVKEQSNQKFPQNSFNERSRLSAFYQELQDMYKQCHKDFRKFITMIEEKVSEIYMDISQQTLANMNHQQIAAQQSKIVISQEILSLNLNVLKVIGRNTNFQYDKQIFKQLNKFQSHLVGYLKTKYPRGQQTFVSGDLTKIFKEFDRVSDLDYDILKNSNTYFGEPEEAKIIKGIKIFINKVMKECDKYFPEFQKLMQDRAFFIKNQKGEKASLNYKIGRKISQNVAKYEDLNSGILQVFSPQVFRVLIKWMQDLEETIRNTSQKISKKQSFKCYVGEKTVKSDPSNPNNVKNDKQLLFDYINQYEYDKIVDSLISRISSLKPKLEGKNKEFVDQLNDFNQRLLKILNQADPKQKYVPTKQIETIKYSSFNAKFVEYILTEKLVYVIKELIKVGQSFISQNTMNLDVIKFRVTDLMRCQVSGNKNQIHQIYNNFRKLEEEQKIQIIKIKNRLSTPLNDAMVIFVMKGSWIICQAQLVLSDTGQKVDKRSKNTELVNHYFYQLERSPYGIMAQIAVLLTYKDSKITYENKITFHQSQVDIERCKAKHRPSVKQEQEQKIPFICSKCSGFYSKSQNLFKIYECKECKTSICSKCILNKNPQLENSFIVREINRQLQQKINQLEKSNRQKRENTTAGSTKKISSKKISPKSILNLFEPQRIKFREKFDNNQKKSGIRKVQVSKLMTQLNYQYGISNKDGQKYFLVVNFFRGEAGFKLYCYEPKYKEIQNTADSRQKYDESSYFSYSDYDLLFFNSYYNEYKRQKNITQNHFFLFMTRSELQSKMDQIKKLKAQGKVKKDQQYQILSIGLIGSSLQLVVDYIAVREKNDTKQGTGDYEDYNQVEKKEFKYPSLAVLGDLLPALKSARNSIQFDDLGIQTKHLDYFRDLSWRHSIKELKLTNNKIENVNIILDNLNSLQRFYFNDNYVKELKFNKPLPNLEILNGSKNQIATIEGLGNIRQIRKLLLENNKLKQFPKTKELTLLNILNLRGNYLSNVMNILQADFPELQQLIISLQFIEYNENQNDMRSEKSQQSSDNFGTFFGRFWNRGDKEEQMVIEFPKLKNFQSQDNDKLLVGKQVCFFSDSLEKISLNSCNIERILFNRRQCIQNLKYVHLSGNRIKYFSFLAVNQTRNHRKLNESFTSDSQFENKPITNDSLITLVLSYNEIQYLPYMKFSSLKRLQLQKNHIKDIKSLQKSKLLDLQYLDLGANPFTELCTLNFPKLTTLKLQEMNQIYKVDTLFKGPSQLPLLESIYFDQTKKIDFNFDLDKQNNKLSKLKQLRFDNVSFQPSKKQSAKFQVSTLENLSLSNSSFIHFPILKLPKITTLNLQNVNAYSFKNLESSKLPQLTDFQMIGAKEIWDQPELLPNFNNAQNRPHQKMVDLSKCLACDFSFPKLKNLRIEDSKIGSLKGLSNNTYNDLESLQLKNIDLKDKKLPKIKAPNLKCMDVSGFNVPNIDYFLNNGFEKLTTLYLNSNDIQLIGENTLSSLPEIKTLSLSNNKLKKFVCNKNLDKLTMLDLSDNKITSFPRIKAKNLSDIRWSQNQINDLSELKNCQLPSLEVIELQSCDFSKSGLPVINMPQLQVLNIISSKLSDVSNLAKSKLPGLKQLNLSYNQLTDFPVVNMGQLDEISLENNKINDLQFLQKSNFESLSVLRLSDNVFKSIPSSLQLSHLKLFECINVVLGSLPLLDFPQLQEINVQFAQLTDISQFAKGQYKLVNNINLSNNKLVHLPSLEMQSLAQVVIDNNLIEDLSDFFDSEFTVTLMQWFSFENNKIKKVPNMLFTNVRVIYLNDNPLQEFNCLTLLEYPQLNGIYLNNTNLKKFKLPKLPKLQTIELTGSKVEDMYWLLSYGQNLPKLRTITMSQCLISQLPNMDQITSLRELYISGNPIKSVDGFIESKLISQMTYLQLDLDVGQNFESVKSKITKKKPSAIVSAYQPIPSN